MAKKYYITDGNIAYKVVPELCTNFKDVLASMTKHIFVYIGHMVDGIHAGYLPESRVIMAKELTFLQLTMRWELYYERLDSGNLLVWHSPSPCRGERMTALWRVPDGFQLFFVWDGIEFHLICLDPDGTQRQLPLPNIYRTGRLCTGTLNMEGESAVERFSNALESWIGNGWNSDIFVGKDELIKQLFRFNENMKQMPPTIAITDLEPTVAEVDLSLLERMR